MEMKELNFYCRVTRVYRKNIDLLIRLSDEHRVKSLQSFFVSDATSDEIFSEASIYLSDSPRLSFSLYALAIIHCYSLVENNRKDILLRLSGLSEKQRAGLFKITVIDAVLSSKGLLHKQVCNYAIAEEFRLVNNAIKHDRYNLSTKIALKNGTVYDANSLKELYLSKSKHLEEYLSDLYRQVSAISISHSQVTPGFEVQPCENVR